MEGPTYVLDADVFIHAKRFYYAFDLAPRFWDCLVEHAANGRVASIDRVKQELARGKDDLATWAQEVFRHAFASTNEDGVVDAYSDVMAWVKAQRQFTDPAVARFADGADGWLVAYATVKSCVVVTQEVAAPYAKVKVKIPDVCQAFSVRFIDTFTMLRQLGVQFA